MRLSLWGPRKGHATVLTIAKHLFDMVRGISEELVELAKFPSGCSLASLEIRVGRLAGGGPDATYLVNVTHPGGPASGQVSGSL